MNIGTGALVSPQAFSEMQPEQKSNYVEVKRDLTELESAKMQIRLYSPCVCGSGKKLKFCCYKR